MMVDDPDAKSRVGDFPTIDEAAAHRGPSRPRVTSRHDAHPLGLPGNGERLGDFELISLLGEGAFARVFLARQISLDRLVAVKVSTNTTDEARTMASLEHRHIVMVFSETVAEDRNLRLLCMQYVPGTTLQDLIQAMRDRPGERWNGEAILATIDARTKHPPSVDPVALRDREFVGRCDFIQTVCWMGARLAEGLHYAHQRGVLHRDVKPANILVNQYGRALLADFNIAADARNAAADVGGGTPRYMAPEALDGFLSGTETGDRRADVYGLALVLYEWLTRELPHPAVPYGTDLRAHMSSLSAYRRSAPRPARDIDSAVPEVLDRTLQINLDPEPDRRFADASALAHALDGCLELERIARELPPPRPFPRAALARPFGWLAVLILAPQIVGSAVNIAYNGLQIVGRLSPAQHAAFGRLVVGYNAIVYPICLAVLIALARPVIAAWRALEEPGPVDPEQIDAARRTALTWPRAIFLVSCAGWLPGALVFPLGIHLLSEPVGATVYTHFVISVTISGLIAVTYSTFGVYFMVLRVLYPRLWADGRGVHAKIAAEISARPTRLWLFQVLAGVIPLVGAILMVGGGPDLIGSGSYRLLITTLILLGMVGFVLAVFVAEMLARTREVLTGTVTLAG